MIGTFVALQLATAPAARAPDTGKCNSSRPDDVVVCGSREGQSPYRLPKLPQTYDEKPVRAETDAIPGVHTRAHVQSEQMPDGNVAKRLMITFSLPF